MRYVPNLIPQPFKVLPDYFKGDIYQPRRQNKLLVVLGWIAGIFFLIGALVSIQHPLLTLLFGLLGFMLLPPGHRWIEKKLRFRFKAKPKALFAGALLIASFPLTGHYSETDKKAEYHEKLVAEKEQQDKLLAEQQDRRRVDSLNFYLQASDRLQSEHKTEDALRKLDNAFAFASTSEDKSQIAQARANISVQKTFALVKAGKYQAALPELNSLISQDGGNTELLYNRAVCNSKTGKIEEAVADCKAAMQQGSKDAERLHDKINPIRKRVIDYLTRCCDDTLSPSNAKGRGACSHHGGVCDWNEPLYEEYRKYE